MQRELLCLLLIYYYSVNANASKSFQQNKRLHSVLSSKLEE
jgi:hypothetical protein